MVSVHECLYGLKCKYFFSGYVQFVSLKYLNKLLLDRGASKPKMLCDYIGLDNFQMMMMMMMIDYLFKVHSRV